MCYSVQKVMRPMFYFDGCRFDNITSTNAIIYDESQAANLSISDTEFIIESGSIYYSQHFVYSSIEIYNISISTDQLSSSNGNGLLYFTPSDEAQMTNINVSYQYNTSKLCRYQHRIQSHTIGESCDVLFCQNPVGFVQNSGKVLMLYINFYNTFI